jgi:hypothetical protein
MKKAYFILNLLLLSATLSLRLAAQEAEIGVAVPLVITGGILETSRAESADPTAASLSAGFRVLVMPQLKLGPHWFAYSAVQVRSTPFFYQDAYNAERKIDTNLLQLFAGYTHSWTGTTLTIKVGKLSSAFGAFPLRYDDAVNPLNDQPLPYTYLALRTSAVGSKNYGLTPVTLYGLPAAEIDLSWRRLDGRFQLTNSSPYNPRSLSESGQYAQWTAGAGYTIRQGLRVGMSAYRGPWLDGSFEPLVPHGSSLSDYPANGLGVDVQWARGAWSVGGEWQRFAFSFPLSAKPSILSFGYVELKGVINPRWYAAFRANYQTDTPSTFFPNRQAYELAVGFRPNRLQLLKVGYEWMKVDGRPGSHDNVFGVQFVTSINGLSKALK